MNNNDFKCIYRRWSGSDSMYWNLERSIVLNSIGRMHVIKATLQCHVYVSRFFHLGIAATSNTPGPLLSVLSWALEV